MKPRIQNDNNPMVTIFNYNILIIRFPYDYQLNMKFPPMQLEPIEC